MCDGDFGAWVAHYAYQEVYGHVVATDIFGDAYVIPLVDTFDDIKECMGATSVELPSPEDCKHGHFHQVASTKNPQTSAPTVLSGMRYSSVLIDGAIESLVTTLERPKDCYAPISTNSARRVPLETPTLSLQQESDHVSRRGFMEDLYVKRWSNSFSYESLSEDDTPYLELPRSIPDEDLGNELDILLSDNPWGAYVDFQASYLDLRDFCKGNVSAAERRAAWLNDKGLGSLSTSQCPREYENPLTAEALYRHLKAQV